MTSDLPERKLVELRQKLDHLGCEFQVWLNDSAEHAPLEKHNSQIEAVTTILRRFHTRASERIDSAQTSAARLAVGTPAARVLLATHRIWEFFRAKLVQRKEQRYQAYLDASDELAWSCYQVVRDAASPELQAKTKEPPLVFFNGGLSPFSISRARAFEGEHVPNELISGPEFARVLKSLPIPVIGVPWHQVSHMPDALVIAHEVGHAVEDDFQLTERMRGCLANVDAARRPVWAAWLGEMFADMFGCLALGPSFAGALMDFLARDPGEVAAEKPLPSDPGRYPPTDLRMRFNLEVVTRMGFAAAAMELKNEWRAQYPEPPATEYDRDLCEIARGLVDESYPQLAGRSLKQVLCFSDQQQQDVAKTVRQIRIDKNLDASTEDRRVLFAALRQSYAESPDEFVAQKQSKVFLRRIVQTIKPGRRDRAAPPTADERATLASSRVELADKLFDQIWQPPRGDGDG